MEPCTIIFTFELPVDESEGAAGGEDDEPEPEHQEHLLVHNVQGEKAHRVKFLRETLYHHGSIRFLIYLTYVNLSDRAVSEEVTLGHLGEDLMHGINLWADGQIIPACLHS